MAVDIKPGSCPNSINLSKNGVIPVAILTTASFDAPTVDAETVSFAGAHYLRWALEDVDGDGDMDVILHFRTQDTNLKPDDTEACLTGQTLGGDPIFGCDSVRIVPAGKDSDLDSAGTNPPLFNDSAEASSGTDQFSACPTSSSHDAWPPDISNDGIVNSVDALWFKGRLLSTIGDPGYSRRLDIFFDGYINSTDVLVLRPFMFTSCTGAPVDNDLDDDGFLNAAEQLITTDPLDACPDTTADDAWPPDIDNNATVNVLDVLRASEHLLTLAGEDGYSARVDLTTDGAVNVLDILTLRLYLLSSCSN